MSSRLRCLVVEPVLGNHAVFSNVTWTNLREVTSSKLALQHTGVSEEAAEVNGSGFVFNPVNVSQSNKECPAAQSNC